MDEPQSMGCLERIAAYGSVGAVVATTIGAAREALKAGAAPKNVPQMAYWADAAGRMAQGTGKTVIGVSLLASAECAMATVRNKEDVWNIAFGGGVMGAYAGIKLGTVHGVVMRTLKYSSGLSLAWLLYHRIKKEQVEWRQPEDELKKRFAYAK